MRRSLMSLALLALIAGPIAGNAAFAAEGAAEKGNHAKHAKVEQRRDQLTHIQEALAKLDLSAEQKTKIDGIVSDARSQLQTLRQSAKDNADKKQLREQAKDIVKKALADIHAVLTPEQQAKLKEMRKEQAENEAKSESTDKAKQ